MFVFKIVLWLIGVVMSLLLIVPLVLIILTFAETDFKVFAPVGIVGAVGLVLGLIGFGIAMAVVRVLTKDFVVPIMYLHGCTVTEGWRYFGSLFWLHPGTFILFLLILIVINMVIGMLTVLLIIATCCLAACILIIPYIGTVALLPVYVWRRAYSALLLAQFGPEFNVFADVSPQVAEGVSESGQNF